ncbi:MAG: aminopeptidase P family protein [Parachlamydiales bacterium]|nr:aminopeptidase P family protein [Parachlamydiales bacterium]
MPDLNSRINKVQHLLEQYDVDIFIVDDPLDIFYLTGLELSVGHLLVSTEVVQLFVDGRYLEYVKTQSVVDTKDILNEQRASEFILDCGISNPKVGFNQSFTTYVNFEKYKGYFARLIPLENFVGQIRLIKEADEIVLLKKAQALNERGYDYVLSILKRGCTEKDIAKQLQIFWLDQGADSLAFDSIIAFGENTSLPHHHPTDKKLEANQPVLIDIGVILNNYHSDMTRVVFTGQPSDKMLEVYDVVKRAQLAAMVLCKPGTPIAHLDRAARQVIIDAGLGDYFNHSLGHGIGLQTHEAPFLRDNKYTESQVLKAGMVLTLEPGVYLPNIGGVRIEDIIHVNDDGYELFNTRSKELMQISL